VSVANIQERKLELIRWLSVVDDVSLIERVAKVRDESINDWWNEISEVEKESIAIGIKDADSGSLKPHSEARACFLRC
jgi:hypothetical protein